MENHFYTAPRAKSAAITAAAAQKPTEILTFRLNKYQRGQGNAENN